MKSKLFNIYPDPSLFSKLASGGHTTSEAIAELVDNSIDDRILDRLLTVRVNIKKQKAYIEITDDGAGMDQDSIEKCLVLGYSKKQEKIGKYGIGMKAASLSLGSRFSISSIPVKQDFEYMLEFDEQEWQAKNDWRNFELKYQPSKDPSGTRIRIDKLKVPLYVTLPGILRKFLAKTFRAYIENKAVKILVNNIECIPDPLDIDGEKEHFELQLKSGVILKGWRALLKKPDQEHGFQLFHYDRLIVPDAKIGFEESPDAKLIIGGLDLSYVPVANNKKNFIRECRQFREIAKKGGVFWKFMEEFVEKARCASQESKFNNAKEREFSRQTCADALDILKSLFDYQDFSKQKKNVISPDLPEDKEEKKIDHPPQDDIAQDIVDVLEPKPIDQLDVDASIKDEKKLEKEKNKDKKSDIYIGGKRFSCIHDYHDLKNSQLAMDKHYNEESGVLHIYTNNRFPYCIESNSRRTIARFNISRAVAEVYLGSTNTNASFSEYQVLVDKMLYGLREKAKARGARNASGSQEKMKNSELEENGQKIEEISL